MAGSSRNAAYLNRRSGETEVTTLLTESSVLTQGAVRWLRVAAALTQS